MLQALVAFESCQAVLLDKGSTEAEPTMPSAEVQAKLHEVFQPEHALHHSHFGTGVSCCQASHLLLEACKLLTYQMHAVQVEHHIHIQHAICLHVIQ